MAADCDAAVADVRVWKSYINLGNCGIPALSAFEDEESGYVAILEV